MNFCASIGRYVLMVGLALGWLTGAAEGANPRWTTGAPYFTNPGNMVIWYTDQPLYFTDPGDLSASVSHAQADAMVAAAAGVWNVPGARMVLAQGGTLDEDVSGANVYMGSGGLVFPADASSTNYAAKQIAVVYDRDGAVTDLLLGGGASDPSGCRQNAVTESVDSIVPDGHIHHAIVVLNGRCTGPAPEQQLQMQYQLERIFGRVLGLGWSQLNDNVFTGSPQPTYAQTLHWPIMHPIDVICGLYTYQCLPEPFTLRDDDLAGIMMLYPVTSNPGPGKQLSTTRTGSLAGALRFPTGEGMAGVNVVVQRNRLPTEVLESFYDVSTVSGVFTQQRAGNPMTPRPGGLAGSWGEMNPQFDVAGYYQMTAIPIADGDPAVDMLLHTEAINPLYTGEYAIAPYVASTVTPSGDSISWRFNYVYPGVGIYTEPTVTGAASTCSASGDGTETAPVAVPAGGWWMGLLCGPNANAPTYFGHTAWNSLTMKAGRSLTVEVTAEDEQGLATATKARPVIGVWHTSDATGTAPSVASAAVAFNSVATGMTTMGVASAAATTLRMVIADERGDGRPDYNYQARVLYADTIAPATGSFNTHITISGLGFRPGNVVTVGGVTATVSSWTATTIVATVPVIASVPAGPAVAEDVVVTDLSTAGSTVMKGAFQYTYVAPVYTLVLVSGPTGSELTTLPASPAFAVKAINVDGVTPMPGVPVVFTATAGTVTWSGCGTAACTVLTDANGVASIVATPTAAGAVTLQAAALGLTQTVSFQAVTLVRSVTVSPGTRYLAAGATASWTATATALQQGQPTVSQAMVWTAASGPMTFSNGVTTTGAQGSTQTTVTAGPLAAGAQAVGSACAWGSVCGSFSAYGVGPAQFVVVTMTGAGQSVPASGTLTPVSFLITDAAGNPVVGATVVIHQTVSQWTAPCPAQGRCPVAPVYQTVDTTAMTDGSGTVVVTPLQIAGAEVTDMVVASGTQGFASLTMQKHP